MVSLQESEIREKSKDTEDYTNLKNFQIILFKKEIIINLIIKVNIAWSFLRMENSQNSQFFSE